MSGMLTVGELIVFTTYLASLYVPVNQLFQTYGLVQGAKAGLRRCFELIELEPEIRARPGARALARVGGEVAFDDVRFGHSPAHPALKGISFNALAAHT